MSGRRSERQTFAEIVAGVPDSPTPQEQWSYSIPRPWITVEGRRWVLRGDSGYEGKQLHKLLRRGELLVFHDYLNERTLIPVDERETFWTTAVRRMSESVHSDFVGYQYKGPDGQHCVVVYEFC